MVDFVLNGAEKTPGLFSRLFKQSVTLKGAKDTSSKTEYSSLIKRLRSSILEVSQKKRTSSSLQDKTSFLKKMNAYMDHDKVSLTQPEKQFVSDSFAKSGVHSFDKFVVKKFLPKLQSELAQDLATQYSDNSENNVVAQLQDIILSIGDAGPDLIALYKNVISQEKKNGYYHPDSLSNKNASIHHKNFVAKFLLASSKGDISPHAERLLFGGKARTWQNFESYEYQIARAFRLREASKNAEEAYQVGSDQGFDLLKQIAVEEKELSTTDSVAQFVLDRIEGHKAQLAEKGQEYKKKYRAYSGMRIDFNPKSFAQFGLQNSEFKQGGSSQQGTQNTSLPQEPLSVSEVKDLFRLNPLPLYYFLVAQKADRLNKTKGTKRDKKTKNEKSVRHLPLSTAGSAVISNGNSFKYEKVYN
ncbi:MAG: hypothetical protein ACTSXQ_07460 [Alphaproteobacteria bacterium]